MLTTVHKIRQFFGIHGSFGENDYLFDVPNWGGYRTQVVMYKFMNIIGNPILNLILRGNWKK